MLKSNPNTRDGKTISARTSEEGDRAKEALTADAAEIIMAIVETTQLLIIHLKKNKDSCLPILQSPKTGIDGLNTRRFLMRYPTYVKTKTIDI